MELLQKRYKSSWNSKITLHDKFFYNDSKEVNANPNLLKENQIRMVPKKSILDPGIILTQINT